MADETGADGVTSANDNSISSLLKDARGHLGNRRFDLAVDVATEAIRLDPRRSEIYVIRAEALRKLNKADRALADLALAIRIDPDRAASYVIRAEIYRKRCLLDQAIADATQAIFLDPNNAAAFSIRASCRQSIGDPEGAAADQDEMFRIDPTRPPVHSPSTITPEPPPTTAPVQRDAYKDLFADGNPVDQSLNARKPVGEVAEKLAELSGYRPETMTRPPARNRTVRGDRGRTPWPLISLILAGVAVAACFVLIDGRGRDKPGAGALVGQKPVPGPSGSAPIEPDPARPVPGARAGGGVATTPSNEAGDPKPEIANLTEINTNESDLFARFSPDGLTIYWVKQTQGGVEGEIWTALRKTPGSLFEGKRPVGHGRHISPSSDGLTMLLVARRADGGTGDSIQVTSRPSADEAFGRPQAVPELATVDSPRNLSLSADGLTLYFVTGTTDGDDARTWETSRRTPKSPWGNPKPLVLSAGPGIRGHVICPFLAADGRTLLGVVTRDGDPRPSFMMWTRSSPDRPFVGPRPLPLPGLGEFFGYQPVLVEATHELFFCSNRLEPVGGKSNIWVVRNFVLPPDLGDVAAEGSGTPPVGQRTTAADGAGVELSPAVGADSEGKSSLKIANITEINTNEREASPWLSPDGLTIYWTVHRPEAPEWEIWTARRKDSGSFFAEKRSVGQGRHIAVSPDGLTMYLVTRRANGKPGESIQVSVRRSTADDFGRSREVAELGPLNMPQSLFLSADERTLLFNDGFSKDGTLRLMESRRSTPQGRWGTPMPVRFEALPSGLPICPHLSSDGLTLLGVPSKTQAGSRRAITTWTRKATDQPFGSPVSLAIPGEGDLRVVFPRFVESTSELFFSSPRSPADEKLDIWMVRNFVLGPKVDKRDGEKIGKVRGFEGHTGTVLGVAFGPDGKLLASAAGDATVRIWDTAPGSSGTSHIVLRTDDTQSKGFIAVAFSPDGKTLAASKFDGGIALWDMTTTPPRPTRVLRKHGDPVVALAFSPDGKSLVSGGRDEGLICFWDMNQQSDTPRATIPAEKNGVWSLAFSPDGKTLAEGVSFPPRGGGTTPGEIWMWDVEWRPYLKRSVIKEVRKVPRSLAFSPDGGRMAFGDGDVARVIEPGTGRSLGSFEGHSSFVVTVAFTPDGKRILSGGYDNALYLWDAATMGQVRRFEGHTGFVEQVAVSPDGRMAASVGHDKTVRLWGLSR